MESDADAANVARGDLNIGGHAQNKAEAPVMNHDSDFWREMDSVEDKMTSEHDVKVWAGTASFAALGTSLVYFMWVVRAGSLLSSLLSSLPVWNLVDPLPVLDSMASADESDDDEDDDEGLESLVMHKNDRMAA